MKKLLLTAFEPFDGKSINSSLEMAKNLDGRSFPDLQVNFIELPVVHNQASEIAIDHILTTQPECGHDVRHCKRPVLYYP